MIAIDRCGYLELFITRKLSWDELITDHEGLQCRRQARSKILDQQLQYSRKFAEEQCESGLSSALFIPGVIDIVKNYFFTQEVEPSLKHDTRVKMTNLGIGGRRRMHGERHRHPTDL